MTTKKRNIIKLPDGARSGQKTESDHWWDMQHSLILRQTPRWAQSVALALILLGGGGIIASSVIKIDEVITVSGTLKPVKGIYELKSPAGGLIKQVNKKEGEYVRKGDLIVQFDTRAAEENIQNIQKQTEEILISSESIQRAHASRVKSLNQSLYTNEQILERMEVLSEAGAVEKNTLLLQRDKVFQLQANVEEANEQQLQRESESKRRLSDLKSQLKQNQIQKQYELVYAPVSGILFDLQAVEQGVLNRAQIIAKLIPQESLKASVSVTNKDIGYIKLKQPAQVRVDSFDYTQFGYIPGYIQSVGAEVKRIEGEEGSASTYSFPVTIALEKNYLEAKGLKIPLQSGMSITANLKLREKRLISVVSDIFNNNYDALTRLRQ